ncbi:MAG: DUF5719 family protein [Bifidobacteriaceae bacterium]|nr:DUF5719 family protein [Bifidobacteriaceae bacterium]
MSNKELNSNKSRIATAIIAGLTGLILLALLVLVLLVPPMSLPVDDEVRNTTTMTQTVKTMQMYSYCPAKMDLIDTAAYGDVQYSPSKGNITASSRSSLFGSVYETQVFHTGDMNSEVQKINNSQNIDDDNIATETSDVNDHSLILHTRLIDAVSGTGVASSVASWATEGDLQGLSASSCQPVSLRQYYMIPKNVEGNSYQLIVANPSAKATSINIRVWGSSQAGELTPANSSTFVVNAHNEAKLNISAAATNQDGLFVSVNSNDTPVASVVRGIHVDGVTANGNDYITPVAAIKSPVITGISSGDSLSAYFYASKNVSARLYWLTTQGRLDAGNVAIRAHKVAIKSIDKVPDDAQALLVDSQNVNVYTAAHIEQSGKDNTKDFAVINGKNSVNSGALSIPDNTSGDLIFANNSNNNATAVLHSYNSEGTELKRKTIQLDAYATTSIKLSDLGDNIAAVMLDSNEHISWTLRLSQSDVEQAEVAGVAVIMPTSFVMQSEEVVTKPDSTIVH